MIKQDNFINLTAILNTEYSTIKLRRIISNEKLLSVREIDKIKPIEEYRNYYNNLDF